jgi:fructose-1,6-bisphosphatase/inositol monophosphatase family enzyme
MNFTWRVKVTKPTEMVSKLLRNGNETCNVFWNTVLEHRCRTTRSIGSGVLDLCYVATGRLDVVYAGLAGEGWKPWDYCAGMVIANEAGCSLQALSGQKEGEDFDIYSDSIICAVNSSLMSKLRTTILGGP